VGSVEAGQEEDRREKEAKVGVGNLRTTARRAVSYQLVIEVPSAVRVQIGRLGEFEFPAGTYVYTGSARRNLEARLARPKRAEKQLRWHIDYLLAVQGVRRTWNKHPARKAPALDEDVKRLADAVEPESCTGLRDRALVLLGFAGAFRRSELVALDVPDLTERDAGLDVRIGRSKTDQEGQGATIATPRVPDSPYCPVRAVRD
jgi:Uri superfamily endonuclease